MNGRWSYYQRLAALYRSYRRREAFVTAPPLRLWVEISSRCNLRCPVCPNKELPAAQKGDMPWPLFQKVIDQGREFAFEINLHHRGEPLLHPEAGRFIGYAAATGTSCRLHTNATLLQGKLSDEILASGLQQLSVSFDGFNAAAYEANRAGAGFVQVSGNIADFLERRRQRKQKHPRVVIEALDLAANEDKGQRHEFVRRFRQLGLDEFVCKQPHNWAGYLDAPPAGCTAAVSACTFPWNALLILFNGDVLPCAQDFFGSLVLGNANDTPLLDIWNGEPMLALRLAFAEGKTTAIPSCSNCDRIRRPTLGGIPVEFLKKLIFRRMT